MEKQVEKEEIICCVQCIKEKDGWCSLYERIVYPQNTCNFAVKKSEESKEN